MVGRTAEVNRLLALVGLAHGTSHFFHLMLPPLFPWLMRDFSLSYTDVGLLTTTFVSLFVLPALCAQWGPTRRPSAGDAEEEELLRRWVGTEPLHEKEAAT